MRPYALAALLAALVLPIPTSAAMRCGWIDNPTPGNYWLTDAQGQWIILTQGSQTEPSGVDLLPDFTEREWVRTNGYYGYGCACMDVETDGDQVTAIMSVRQLALNKCRRDPALEKR